MPLFLTPHTITNRLATIGAAIALGLACSQVVVQFIPAGASSAKTAVVETLSSSPEKRPGPDYADIAQWELFGKPKSEVQPKQREAVAIVAPETRLNLALQGIVHSNIPAEGIAIISEPGKPQKTYHLGDALPGNATLYALEQSRVILQRNGRHETLSLRKPSTTQEPTIDQPNQLPQPIKSLQAQTHQKLM